MHIFLDESGQFTKHNHEQYFVIGSFTVGDFKRTKKDFRTFHLKIIKYISNLDVRIRYIYLLRDNIPKEYRKGDKFKDGLLYTNIVGELLDMYLPSVDGDFRVFCDQRKLSGMTDADFKRIIKARALPKLPQRCVVQVETVDSATDVNIQIADWISGALSRYLEKGKMGEDFYKALAGNIIVKAKNFLIFMLYQIDLFQHKKSLRSRHFLVEVAV